MFLPVAGMNPSQLADTFGADRDGGARRHKGIDIFADESTSVVAARGGTVVKAGTAGKGGTRAWVRDDEGFYHYYAHMNRLSVSAGQRVEAGQEIGGVGRTGNAANTPAHLHYSVNFGGGTSEADSMNPYNFLMGKRSDQLQVAANAELPGQPPAQRRSPSGIMAGIMQAISRAASGDGEGRILDVNALFGQTSPSGPRAGPDAELPDPATSGVSKAAGRWEPPPGGINDRDN